MVRSLALPIPQATAPWLPGSLPPHRMQTLSLPIHYLQTLLQTINTPTNAIDNLGIPVGTLKDIVLASRSTTTPDVGAIEFVTPPCTSPPTAGTANSSATATCIGSQIQLSLLGNSVGTGQTYQWQTAPTASGPWSNIGPAGITSAYAPVITGSAYFRAIVTCGSVSLQFQIPC